MMQLRARRSTWRFRRTLVGLKCQLKDAYLYVDEFQTYPRGVEVLGYLIRAEPPI